MSALSRLLKQSVRLEELRVNSIPKSAMLCTLDAVLLALRCEVFPSFASPASTAESTLDSPVGEVMMLDSR